MMPSIRLRRYRQILTLFTVLGLGPGCFLYPKLERITRLTKGARADAFVIGSFVIERNLDQTSAAVKFETIFTASCEIAFYVQTKTVAPDPASLTWAACVSAQPGRIFAETITGLDPAKFYTVAVKLWQQTETKEQGKISTVDESVSPGDPATTYVFRVDSPTLGGVVEPLKLAQTPDESIQKLTSPKACELTTGDFKASDLGENLTAISLLRLSSRGFLTGATGVAATPTGTLSFKASSRQAAAKEWVINMQSKEGSGSLRLAKPSLIKEATMTVGSEQTALTEARLEDTDLPKAAVSGSDLKVSWSLDQPTETGAVTLSLVSYTGLGTVVCRVSAKESSLTVSKDLAAKLSPGEGYLSLGIETVQAFAAQRWLIRSSDWRSQRVRW